ncbi:hypothetical protein R3Q06_23095 [Rhodococcus erythropolis]|uniref:hypothetical protein n=1 Tax=Rhodococcus erythropolis TaxID=1833 RepID=UPI0029490273|nr:hypothetical protein [Rhodococcus erythropolis]MDV6276389.1 hypothetical protein [Rhodococcus erythropolis]
MTEHWFIPKQEQIEIVDALTDVKNIITDLAAATVTALRAANWQPKVTTGDRPQPLPYNAHAQDAADRLLLVLEAWALWLTETRHMTPPNCTYAADYATWLTHNILILAATPGSESAHHGITTEIRHARHATGHTPPNPKPNPHRLALAGQQQLTSNEITTLAKQAGVEGLTQKRINNLKLCGHITPVDYNEIGKKKIAIYRLADVLEAHDTTGTWKKQNTA